MPVIPTFVSLRQKTFEFKASVGSTVRPCQKGRKGEAEEGKVR
jgi:hypothetical protein